MQPHFENNIYMYCYFIDFIIIGLLLPLSMLIGAIVANFHKHKIKISIRKKQNYDHCPYSAVTDLSLFLL